MIQCNNALSHSMNYVLNDQVRKKKITGSFNFKAKSMWRHDLGLETGCKKGNLSRSYAGYARNAFLSKGAKLNHNFLYFSGLYR